MSKLLAFLIRESQRSWSGNDHWPAFGVKGTPASPAYTSPALPFGPLVLGHSLSLPARAGVGWDRIRGHAAWLPPARRHPADPTRPNRKKRTTVGRIQTSNTPQAGGKKLPIPAPVGTARSRDIPSDAPSTRTAEIAQGGTRSYNRT
jgi:hypothetical protein